MPYHLELTERDETTIAFVGHRYQWSRILGRYSAGTAELSEAEVWELAEAIEQEGLPMLDPRSELHHKLLELLERIV
jgi:hypothetical protein